MKMEEPETAKQQQQPQQQEKEDDDDETTASLKVSSLRALLLAKRHSTLNKINIKKANKL